MTNTRLNKFLSKSGVSSRRRADDLIKSGKVFINSEKASVGTTVGPNDKVTINGKLIEPPKQFSYYAFNKPTGVITSLSDDQGLSIKKFVPKGLGLFPIGRLDKDTSGLLILTNDGEFANEISHPSFTKEKVYHLTYGGKPTTLGREGIVRQFLRGIMHGGKRYYVDKAKFIGDSVIEITLHQGKSHQLRIMAGKIGLEVKSLKRVSIGKLKLSELKIASGKIKEIKKSQVL